MNKLIEIEIKVLKIAGSIKKLQNKKVDFSLIFDSLEMLDFIEKLENKFNIKLD